MTPDAFLNDWYGYITNQSGHFFLGMALSLFVPVWLIAAGYVAWEVLSGWLWWDSVEDISFVVLGVAFYTYGRKYAIIIAMCIMSIGVYKRGRK